MLSSVFKSTAEQLQAGRKKKKAADSLDDVFIKDSRLLFTVSGIQECPAHVDLYSRRDGKTLARHGHKCVFLSGASNLPLTQVGAFKSSYNEE